MGNARRVLSSEHKFGPSINVSLPSDCEELIRQRVDASKARGEIEVWTTVIHGALWQMRNRDKTKAELRHELEEALLEGINSGPAVKYNREEFRARAETHLQEFRVARERGLVGNLSLPKELFAFVQEQVRLGRFASPTDVVCEALRTTQEAV